MVKINKIYTRSGDKGETGLVGGQRVKKRSLRIRTFGGVDELNAWLGVIRTLTEDHDLEKILAKIQNDLFDIGAELATLPGSEWPTMEKLSAVHTAALEKQIDKYTENVPDLTSFVLPGGSLINSYLHVARTVCRRVECDCWQLAEEEQKISSFILTYLNRLSDLLFALSRYVIHSAGGTEYLWKPGGK
jgi:cob(I)alamin adenosyltransferase